LPVTEPPLWHCPTCGARLVSRNLWHSCGRFTLEALFAGSADLDAELRAWLQESRDIVGMQSDLAARRRGRAKR